ncbi:MAG: hypothetical protein RIR26_2469 [Pseudomonadota bacterium]
MRGLWKAFDGSERTFSFAEKVAMVVSAIGISVFALSISYAAIAYKKDKEAYLFELQALRARSVAMQFRAALMEQRSNAILIATKNELPSASEVGASRLPEKNETFVVRSDAPDLRKKMSPTLPVLPSHLILYRSAQGELLASPLKELNFPQQDGTLFAVSASGELIFSSGNQAPSGLNLDKRPSVQTALESGLSESTTLVVSQGQDWVFSYREIPETNVFVFAEAPLETVMEPFYRAVEIWLFYGLAIVLVGGFIGFIATKNIVKPARLAAQYLSQLTQGDYSVKPDYKSKDEFLAVFSGIQFLAESILKRDNRLGYLRNGLETILQDSATWSTELDTSEFHRACARLCGRVLHVLQPSAIGCANEHVNEVFSAFNFELSEGIFWSSSTQGKLEIPVLSRDGKLLMTIGIYGIDESKMWPETQQITKYLSEAVRDYYERRSSFQLKLIQTQQASEMAIAASIQDRLITFPHSVPNTEIAYHWIPANDVGGDWLAAFYDERKNVLRFFLGDATGHGIAPALVTAVVAGAVQTFYRVKSPAQELSGVSLKDETQLLQELSVELNSVVCEASKKRLGSGEQEIGMTMLMGCLDCRTGKLLLCNMGHPLPVFIGQNSKSEEEIASILSFSYLGSESFQVPAISEIALNPNSGILLFSDGLIENYDGNLKKRWMRRRASQSQSARDTLNSILKEYQTIGKEHGQQSDDVSLLAITWKGN